MTPVIDRFWTKVEIVGDCWRWTGPKTATGYGVFKVSYSNIRAHRWSYEYFIGPIPTGLTLDHLCHTRESRTCTDGDLCLHRRCVNPAHLEPVTHRVNISRGVRASQTHCKRGHEKTPENRYAKDCRPCALDRVRRRRDALRGTA